MASITSFKVRMGFHSDGQQVYRKGQVFQSKKPLHKMFPNKFDVVPTPKNAKLKTEEETSEEGNAKRPRYNRVNALEELGKDVSAKFPDAVNQGYKVWQNEDGEYCVSDENDLFTPLNKKPLTKMATKKFLRNL